LPTPFDENDAINAAAFEHFYELQISNGATALVVGGTTGEAPNLSREEHCKLLRIATGVSRGRVRIIAGAGSNSTQHAIELGASWAQTLDRGSQEATAPQCPCHRARQ
jgi:4-hydroxy-tetrahydrodipicolinate synthase